MTDQVARQLADFCTGLRLSAVPEGILETIKQNTLDTLGVMLAGSRTEVPRAMLRVAGSMGGRPESTVAGTAHRLPAALAALANGASAHSLELDGGHDGSNVHPQAVVVPAVLALGEAVGASGRDALVAALVGFEVMARMGLSLFPSHARRGFHPTGSCGTFGAAAAAARLLGLKAEQTEAALGLAATQATALRGDSSAGSSSTAKRIHAGTAAHNGILAALMAREGIPCGQGVVSSNRGFLRLFSDGPDLEKLLGGLGEHFATERCYLKGFASCRHSHAPMDSVLGLQAKHSIDPGKIRRIEVRIYREGANYDTQEPASPSHAQFSIPYSIAVVLLDGRALLGQYTEERLADPTVRALARRIEVCFDPEMDRQFLETKQRAHLVRVEMESGEVWTAQTPYPKGSSRNPMSRAEVESKFLDLATTVIEKDSALRIRELVARMEEVENVALLGALLAGPEAQQGR